MADWYGTARSNYFKVRPECKEEFEKFCKDHDVSIEQQRDRTAGKPTGYIMIHTLDTDKGAWPSWDLETDADIDMVATLQQWITDDSIVVLMEAGAEKARYVTGNAVAFTKKRRLGQISLHDIYKLAAKRLKVDIDDIPVAEY